MSEISAAYRAAPSRPGNGDEETAAAAAAAADGDNDNDQERTSGEVSDALLGNKEEETDIKEEEKKDDEDSVSFNTPYYVFEEGVKMSDKIKSRRTQWKQWAACISATLSMVAAGTVYGWTTTTTTQLTDPKLEAPFHITKDQSSWVISVTVIGSMMGPFYGAYVAATWGRKVCLLITSVFYIIGWLLVLFATNVWYLYFSRVILGVGVGMSYTANPMYVSEVADVNIRGALSTLIAVNVFTGSLLACTVGPWTEYHILGFVMLGVPIVFILTFSWFPESPYYLLSKGRKMAAIKAIAFFKDISNSEEIRSEIEEVRRNIVGSNGEFMELDFKFKDFLLLTKSNNLKALLIVMSLILGQQLSGNFSTMQYLEALFVEAKVGINSHVATIIVLAVGLVSGAVCTMTVEGAGRRLLLIVSSFGCAVTLCTLSVYMSMSASGSDVSSVNLLPVIVVILFQVVYQIGLGTMPNLLIGELFPTNVKGIAGAVITVFDGLMGFVISKLYEVVGTNVGSHVSYGVFSISCFLLFVFIFRSVPETKRKTFSEIQDILAKTSFPLSKKCGKSKISEEATIEETA